MPKVIIEVSAGCVIGVFSSDPDLEVEIQDWDNISQEDHSPEELTALESEFDAKMDAL